jgi:hypothetical protein
MFLGARHRSSFQFNDLMPPRRQLLQSLAAHERHFIVCDDLGRFTLNAEYRFQFDLPSTSHIVSLTIHWVDLRLFFDSLTNSTLGGPIWREVRSRRNYLK